MQAEARKINIPLAVLALVAAGVALIALKGILMPLVVAFFLANLAGPSIGFMKRKGIPMGLSLIIILLGLKHWPTHPTNRGKEEQ